MAEAPVPPSTFPSAASSTPETIRTSMVSSLGSPLTNSDPDNNQTPRQLSVRVTFLIISNRHSQLLQQSLQYETEYEKFYRDYTPFVAPHLSDLYHFPTDDLVITTIPKIPRTRISHEPVRNYKTKTNLNYNLVRHRTERSRSLHTRLLSVLLYTLQTIQAKIR